MLSLKVFLCLLLLNVGINQSHAAGKMVCYFGGWSVYRPGNGNFAIENIPPGICTHLIYSFVGITDDANIKVLDPYADLTENFGKGGFKKLVSLKAASPQLKVLVAMGGWNEGSTRYSNIFKDAGKRVKFAQNAAAFLKFHGFDGLDLDWEYPAQRGGAAADKANFVELLKALRTEFDKSGFLVTAAVAAAESSVVQSYDVPALGRYLDFINIMTYDFHGTWETTAGHNSPLYVSSVEKNTPQAGLNVDASIQAWIRLGAPAQKIVLGVGLYGHSFALQNSALTAPRSPVTGAGNAGQFTGEAGLLGYNEICIIEAKTTTKKFWDTEAQIPYLANGNQWVSYDDRRSAQMKVDYIKKFKLGGAMVWSIDTDDFRGDCGMGKYPVLNVLSNGMKGSTVILSPPAPAVISPPAPVVSSQLCSKESYVRDPAQCEKFYYCQLDGSTFITHTFTCPAGLAFNTNHNNCDYKDNVAC